MIKFTKMDGRSVYLNVDQIVSVIGLVGDQTDIYTCEDCYRVTESPSEVARKVLEYKLAMASYNVYLAGGDIDSAIFERNYVKRLAGLEESQ